jgi:hypothetical protein
VGTIPSNMLFYGGTRLGEIQMSRTTAYQYRQRADHCLEIARVLEHVRHRKMALDMAEAWLRLAEQAEKAQNPFAPYQNARRRESPHADCMSVPTARNGSRIADSAS